MFEVGHRITELREKRGLTVNRLANLAGISQSHLRDIELGKKQPTVACLEYICYALKVSLVEFFNVEAADVDEISPVITHLNDTQRKALINFLKTL